MSKHITKNTVIITGVANGGTSVTAAICEALGYYMGEDKHTYEDKEFQEAMRGLPKDFDKFIKARNAKYERWGFKKPTIPFQLEMLRDSLYDAYFIVVTRDPIATAMRVGRKSNPSREAILSRARQVCEQEREALDVVEKLWLKNANVYLLSYEKLLVHPEKIVGEIAAFLRCQTPKNRIEKIAKMVSPEHGHPPR